MHSDLQDFSPTTPAYTTNSNIIIVLFSLFFFFLYNGEIYRRSPDRRHDVPASVSNDSNRGSEIFFFFLL